MSRAAHWAMWYKCLHHVDNARPKPNRMLRKQEKNHQEVTYSTKDYSFKLFITSPIATLTLHTARITQHRIYASWFKVSTGHFLYFSLLPEERGRLRATVLKNTQHICLEAEQKRCLRKCHWGDGSGRMVTAHRQTAKIISSNKDTKWSEIQEWKRTSHGEIQLLNFLPTE